MNDWKKTNQTEERGGVRAVGGSSQCGGEGLGFPEEQQKRGF